MGFAGIDALINVTMAKVNNANNNAMDGATKQRKLVAAEQKLHAQQARFEDIVTKGKSDGLSASDQAAINGFLHDQGLDAQGTTLSLHGDLSNGHTVKADDAGSADEKANANAINAVRTAFDNKDKDLQNQDKLGNFEIQGLMGTFNESQTLASSVLNKKDSAGNAVIQKI